MSSITKQGFVNYTQYSVIKYNRKHTLTEVGISARAERVSAKVEAEFLVHCATATPVDAELRRMAKRDMAPTGAATVGMAPTVVGVLASAPASASVPATRKPPEKFNRPRLSPGVTILELLGILKPQKPPMSAEDAADALLAAAGVR